MCRSSHYHITHSHALLLFSAGLGLGSLLGGEISAAVASDTDRSGFKGLFLVSSITCGVVLVIYELLYEVVIRRCFPLKLTKQTQQDKDNASDIEGVYNAG